MPQRNKPHLAVRHLHDPLTACLDADGTYICTAYNSRCYIIQKCSPLPVIPPTGKQPSSAKNQRLQSDGTAKIPLPSPPSQNPLVRRRNVCKVTKANSAVGANLNPDADVFESKSKRSAGNDTYEMVESDFPPLEDVAESIDLSSHDAMFLWHVPLVSSIFQGFPEIFHKVSQIDPTGNVYMNGDVGKVPSGAVFTASPEPQPPTPTSEFSLLNGGSEVEGNQGGLETYSESGAGSAPEQPPDPQPPIPLDQLKQMLSSQLEYYFSRENLANDTYLLSQMDNDQYVPIWTVANFNQVKKLTTDIKLITEVLRESPNVQVDDEGIKVRPNHKRCIVILREIPDSTPLEEVKGLFSGKGCPKLISCEFAHNNSWYVTFENDEDAQKAYRFLREEVREFQGKPIMARIKAKPMNRLPLPPGIGTGGIGNIKNGFRTQPAPASTGPGVFEPSPFPPPTQRYLFSNGSSLPHNVNYANQVQIYVSNFQQHQPFYHPSMLPTWGPTSPAYFDIGSVFSVNGLAPQGGPFTKSHTTRFTPRNSRQKKSGGLEARTAMSDSGIIRKPTTKENTRFDSTDNQRHEDDPYRPLQSKDQVLPPRRRRKEDEGGSRTSGSPGPQFDLEADAFPPLPGGQVPPLAEQPAPQPTAHQPPVTTAVSPLSTATTPASVDHAQWAENRLSDVVKGSVKGRLVGGEDGCSNGSTTSVDDKERTSPTHPIIIPRSSPSIPILPPTPDKTVIGIGGVKGPPEKGQQIKTDDSSLSGSTFNGESGAVEQQPLAEPKLTPPLLPPTAPAETHLPVHQPPTQAELGVVKLSYAQVAQHHHKEKIERERIAAREQQPQQQQPQQTNPLPPQQPPLPPQPQPQPQQHHSDDEKKEHNPPPFHYQMKGDGLGSRGRGGARGAPRRRDNLPRQFNSRQRSPK